MKRCSELFNVKIVWGSKAPAKTSKSPFETRLIETCEWSYALHGQKQQKFTAVSDSTVQIKPK